jgi:sugar phosphate isomerase/epimerase
MSERNIKLGVSLYSYQDNYYFHKHDLEGCIAAAAGSGATGIEIFPEAMIPEWPYISDAFVDKWNGWMERYGVEPVCLDHFSDRAMWKNRQLTDDELYERSTWYVKAARKLGCSTVRVLHNEHIGLGISPYRLTDVGIVERLLPLCAELNVMLALECHAPTTIDNPIHAPYMETAERLGLPFVGLQADFSSYEYCMSSADVGQVARQGGHAEILNFVRDSQREAYFAGKPFCYDDIRAQVERMGPNDVDMRLLRFVGFSRGPASYDILKEYASRLVYVHGKFCDIDADGQVDNIDYSKVMGALVAGGYKGYICSEFEGNRRMNDAGWCDEIEYVRKHQKLMRKCLSY